MRNLIGFGRVVVFVVPALVGYLLFILCFTIVFGVDEGTAMARAIKEELS